MAWRLRSHRAVAVLTLLVLIVSAIATVSVVPSPTRAASETPAGYLLYDNFTQDTGLNSALWQINGSVGAVYGLDDVGIQSILLAPTFSPSGMEIAQVNTSYTAGTIQSIDSFTPPFTATAVVEGTISHGHTFGFAIASTNASTGVAIIGNLNSTDCSSMGNCGDPTTCGISANPATTPSNQCYYGIFARIAGGGGKWTKVEPKLDLTPSVGVYYTLQISIDVSGSAQYSVSQGGQVINEATTQVGSGPFYIIIEQGEGAPVPGHGPNQAYWASVAVTPSSVSTSSSTQTGLAPSPEGASTLIWIIIAIVIVILLFIFFLLYGRRRGFVVTVLDAGTSSPISKASVSAAGPKNLSGYTRDNGNVNFGAVKDGDYTVNASAAGYSPSAPVVVRVEKKTKHTLKLARLAPVNQGAGAGDMPPAGPDKGEAMTPTSISQGQQVQGGVTQPLKPGPIPSMPQPESVVHSSDQRGPDEFEGWGGGRVREIIKTFQARGAISPETAMTAEELGLSRLFVRIMKRRKGKTTIFIEVNGKYYLNQKALQDS